eukprot:g8499.t1
MGELEAEREALQAKLKGELAAAEREIEDRVQEVGKSIQQARSQVRDHCDRVERALEKRRFLLLQEVDRLELQRVRVLEKQKKQLRKIRRCVDQDLHAGGGDQDHGEKIEKYLRGFDLHRSESSCDRMQLLRELQQRVITEPCADAEVYLDLREEQLIPLLERFGAVSPLPITYHQTPLELPEAERPALPKQAKHVVTLLSGGLAGVTSASVTHWLDVAKVLRQVGARPPRSWAEWRTYFLGLPMGAVAQGQRFGLTLLIDQNMQRELRKWSEKAKAEKQKDNAEGAGSSVAFANYFSVISFAGSMVAAGTGEFLAMPPVVVKNYQIARNERSSYAAMKQLHRLDGMRAFFKGVLAGVVRKSLANAIVLQAIGPTKFLLAPLFSGTSNSSATQNKMNGTSGSSGSQSLFQKMGVGFLAGSLTGSFAEVATNYPDRIKTLMHTKGKISLYNAALEAARDPFRGALWAGLRKGLIRGINWGTVGAWTSILEDGYWKFYAVGEDANRGGRADHGQKNYYARG